METMEAQVEKMEKQVKQWGTKLEELAAKVDEAGAEAKADREKRISELKAGHKAAMAKLDELKAAGSDKWEIVKGGIESAWKDLEAAFKKLTN